MNGAEKVRRIEALMADADRSWRETERQFLLVSDAIRESGLTGAEVGRALFMTDATEVAMLDHVAWGDEVLTVRLGSVQAALVDRDDYEMEEA